MRKGVLLADGAEPLPAEKEGLFRMGSDESDTEWIQFHDVVEGRCGSSCPGKTCGGFLRLERAAQWPLSRPDASREVLSLTVSPCRRSLWLQA